MEAPLLKCEFKNNCKYGCKTKTMVYSNENKPIEILLLLEKYSDISFRYAQSIMKRFNTPFAITYAMKYFGKRDTCCMGALKEEIRQLNPKVIVCLGVGPLNFFRNNKAFNEFDDRGRFHESFNIDGVKYPVYATINPSVFSERPSMAGIFNNDLERVVDVNLRRLKMCEGKSILLKTFDEVKTYLNKLIYETTSPVIGFDTEARNLNKIDNKLFTMQFSEDGKVSYVIGWEHPTITWTEQERSELRALIIRLFTGETKFKAFVAHNAKFDFLQIYNKFGVLPRQTIIDTIAGAWLLNENRLELGKKGPFSLEYCFKEYGLGKYGANLGVISKKDVEQLEKFPIEDIVKNGKTIKKGFLEYAGRDAYGVLQLYYIYRKIAEKQNYLKKWHTLLKCYYSEIIKMFVVMEYNGAKVDEDQIRFLKGADSPIKQRMSEIEKELSKSENVKKTSQIMLSGNKLRGMQPLFGEMPNLFDINKKKPKRILFFDVLKLKPITYGKPDVATYKDKKCKHSLIDIPEKFIKECPKCGGIVYGNLDNSFQEEYKHIPEVALYTEYNQMKKLTTSYVNTMYKFLREESDCRDGRLRPNQNFTGTVTSRTSTSNPNLAQIPRANTGAKRAIKDLFIPETGKLLIQMDYATAEVRGLGIISKDKTLSDLYNKAEVKRLAFLSNPLDEKLKKDAELSGDIHKLTASTMFGVSVEEVTKEMRQAAKGITFGLIYGMGTNTLAENLGKTEAETKKLVNKFFSLFPDAQTWIKKEYAFAEKNMYVENPMGIRRRLPAFLTDVSWAKAKSKRQSVNSEIQGMCAQFAMLGCALVNRYILEKDLIRKCGWKIVNYVHDSLSWEVYPQFAKKSIQVAQELMSKGVMDYCIKNFGMEFNLPILVDAEVGLRLGSLKKWDGTDKEWITLMKSFGLETTDGKWSFKK
jgi:DNA polymerase I-like protein with 3'-5' exonuclease and polymerase domains